MKIKKKKEEEEEIKNTFKNIFSQTLYRQRLSKYIYLQISQIKEKVFVSLQKKNKKKFKISNFGSLILERKP